MAHEIRVPRLGWSMEVGTFLGWRKQAGEMVRVGEPLFELEGEKAAQEIEAIEAGILHIDPACPSAGTEVPVGALLGYLAAHDEPSPYEIRSTDQTERSDNNTSLGPQEAGKNHSSVNPTAGRRHLSPSARRRARELGIEVHQIAGSGPVGRVTRHDIDAQVARRQATRHEVSTAKSTDGAPIATPRARRVARELGVDWQMLNGSGRDGRIREVDVQQAANQLEVAASSSEVRPELAAIEPVSNRRRVIARRMLASHQQTAPVTLTTTVDAANLVNFRDQFKITNEAIVPSYNDIMVKLVANVLLRHPRMAARWDSDRLVVPHTDDLAIGIAVDTDDGLLVPVLRHVPQTPLLQLAQEATTLIAAARAGQLSLDALQGADFTVTNLGALGIDAFTPIINLPEAAILGIGAIRREAVVGIDDQIVPGLRLTLSLTFDHRINDGAPAARFLSDVREAFENPVPRLVASC